MSDVVKTYLTWDDIDNLVDTLCSKISQSPLRIKQVAGVERGGLIPAVMISHRLNLPYVYRVTKDTLLIDDICDTGNTLKYVPGLATATLHYKPTAIATPTFYAEQVTDANTWIVYPWERSDSDTIQDYLKNK